MSHRAPRGRSPRALGEDACLAVKAKMATVVKRNTVCRIERKAERPRAKWPQNKKAAGLGADAGAHECGKAACGQTAEQENGVAWV